ncbi:hypothetical protein QYE76_059197 [Lolium multiflorum]|uniref:CCHC-type domain-containing protein n=1 Tax=Lolium multiflorum TaxID=4521 RepID=A0AAD8Q4Y1_LOLMU|nr:hypothetical protein QYE76_059197 [Lolium multiflorum]
MVGRGRPPLPPQVARDEGIRPRRRNMEDEENMYGKLKFNMPKFKGEDDAEAYLSWALKVDKIFRIHNYSGAKKVAMASLEFEDYANTWWEQVVTLREEKGDPPIDTWEDMKEEMEARFVPKHYKTDLFNKLQKLKQGTKTVEEFFKEMELTMMRANIQESENQTIARFFNGLNYPIKRIVEFQQYSNMVELVHQASKAERQVNEDIKYSKSKQYFASKLATSTPTTSVKPTASSTPSKQPSIQSRMKQTVSSTASSKASTGPSNVTCFKCGTQGHKSFECKNTKVMITMENGDIETLSEGEYEALVQAAVANEEDYDEESGEDPLLCTHDPSPSLVVTRVLTTQPQAMEDQRCNIFQTRAGIGGKSIKVIIDGGSCHNLASTELCEKLNLTLRKHPHPYHVQWLSDKGNVKIQHTVTVNFKIGPYEDTVECDVVPMTVCHMLLGRPWQFDKKAIHDGFSNAYTFKVKDKKFELRPMTPSQIIADNAKALARAQHHIHHSESLISHIVESLISMSMASSMSEQPSKEEDNTRGVDVKLLEIQVSSLDSWDTEEYTEHFEEDTSSSTADVEEHVELYTDYGSASIANMTDIEELYIDTCSTSMDDMVEHHHEDDIDPTIVPNMIVIDTLLRAPQGAIMRVPMHKIIDITDIIWSIKSAPNMSHHLGKARTVIDSHHLMIVVDHHHLMVYIDILPHMIFDDTTQDMVMRQEDESLDMKTFLIRRLLPLAPPPQWPLPRHMPMDSDATSASNKATFHGNVPISYVSAKKLYFDELNAQVSKMPPLEDDLGGDGVEHGEHGILPSPTEAHGVEMVEHGKFPSTKEAHGDEQVEPTPTCLIDELVPIPCEHESHLAHLSESASELSDFHPICEFECFHLEDMSVTQSSTEDEFPLMEKMYMVHEDDDISPCLLQDGHVDHMDPPTSTTPTSHESAFKGTSVKTQAMESKPMERELEMMKMELQRTGRNFRPPGPELPPPRTGTSALQDRNFLPDAAKMPSSAQRSGTSRNFRPEGPELPPTRNFRPSSAQVPKVRQNAPGCYCKETG